MELKRNWYHLFTETVCLILMIGILLYLFLNWGSFPNKIPGHYNAAGVADRPGNKGELLVTPLLDVYCT